MCARRRSGFLLRRQKKVTKEKATPLSASPALRAGATCGALGLGASQNSLRAGALRSNNCDEPVHEACVSFGTQATPPAALLGAYRGAGETTSLRAIASLRCARPHLAGASARRCAYWAERSNGPCGCSDVRMSKPLLAAPASGRLRGEHARRSAYASLSSSPQLSERSCKAAQ